MEKEHQPDSMATITMKAEYPPSESVYSASEPPPAYRQGVSSSVQIARIIALTVVASSLILGSFMLASSWVAARASCHQLEQLDAMLDKELALEGRAYGNDALLADEPLPVNNAHALHAAPPQQSLAAPDAPAIAPQAFSQHKEDALAQAESKLDEDKLQKIDNTPKKDTVNSDSDESSESDSSAEDDDDLEALRPIFKMPIQFDLDELAGAFLANSQKGRMNCVVERRNEDAMERRFPFSILGAFAPRPAQAERVAIICHGGDEPRPMPEPQSQVFAFPLSGPVRLPLRPQPDSPADRSPFSPLAPLGSFSQHRPSPFPMHMPWESSDEQMLPPREMRIHVQRVVAVPAHQLPQDIMGPFAPPPPPQMHHDQNEEQDVMNQFIPQNAPTQDMEQPEDQKMSNGMPMDLPWGLTPEDIAAIQRSAEDVTQHHQDQQQQQQIDNDMQEVKTIVNTLAAAAAEAEAEAAAAEDQRQQRARGSSGDVRAPRTLLLPQEAPSDERPHYVQPRSVRSVDSLLHREKRMKRCACDCE